MLFEKNRNPDFSTVRSGYQWLGPTLFESASAYTIQTVPGYVVYYIVRIAGVSLIAFGTITSRLVAAIVLKGKGMGSTNAKGHILISGWTAEAPRSSASCGQRT